MNFCKISKILTQNLNSLQNRICNTLKCIFARQFHALKKCIAKQNAEERKKKNVLSDKRKNKINDKEAERKKMSG